MIHTCVSLYSFQNEFLNHRMTLPEIMEFVKGMGTEGVEILPDQMLKGAPYVSEKDIAEWNGLIVKTGLKPVCADVFLNTNLYKNRTLTKKECINLLIDEIKLAHNLGMKLIRLVSMTPYWVIEPLLPYCEKYDVTIALEVHAAMAFDIPETRAFINEVYRLKSPYAGIVVDTGIFCDRLPRVACEYEQKHGVSREVFEYINGLFENGSNLHKEIVKYGGELPPELKALCQTPQDWISATLFGGYENVPLSALDEHISIIKHFHFKLWEMTDDGEYSIDYMKVLKHLQKIGYDGYVSTEYEGNRFVPEGEPMNELEMVPKHQRYIRKCLDEIQGR